ncbi:V-set and immunoglobulin domain-containing protein 8a [Hippoglossus hippoglossus]|uniref:V-set and immunoglobulin domain-containing protein 8a n=1 Tax=Hippoglossus hippoglossus TaxID=8267 RepID=UPI00148BD452|nr:V-set and immunoglobulin domain-containing protein 8a [Hippoglossus hippoglossus]
MWRLSCRRRVSALCLGCLPWISGFLLHTATLLSMGLGYAQGLQVTSTGPLTIQKAEGESVILGCGYTLSPFDSGELDIEWSVVSPDTTKKDQMLLSYTGGTEYVHGDAALAHGLHFAAPDPSRGDASLSVAALSPAHSATYQCKVKKSPGLDTRKVSLVVMVKPSVPKCWVEGGELLGEAVALHCQSARGSAPLTYSWRRESEAPIPDTTTQNRVTGELRISNHSQSLAGFYLCEVNNAVGAERCRINLKANKPPNRAAVIVGTVVGSLLLILILLLFIGLLYWKLSGRFRYEKEFSNEIREDVPPPESRPASRHTSRTVSQHPRVSYSPVGGGGTEVSSLSEGPTHPPSCSTPVKSKPVEYDDRNGHAV